MKRLLLTIPLLMSTMAVGPCAPIPIGNLDGGAGGLPGTGGARTDAGTGGAAVDAGSGGGPGTGGGSGGAGTGGRGTGGGSGGSGGSGGAGGSGGGGGGRRPVCEGTGWLSESVFYADATRPIFDMQLDANDALHMVSMASVLGFNGIAYIRRLPGGTFDWPVTFVSDTGSAVPCVGLESNGRAHVAFTGWAANDNILYQRMNDDGSWVVSTVERAATGMGMTPLHVQVLSSGDPFVVYAGPGSNTGGFAIKRNGTWSGSTLPVLRFAGVGVIDAAATPHVLFGSAAGVSHAIVQADATAVTETVSTVAATAVRLVSDSAGKLHAIYSGNEPGVRYAARGNTAWVEEMIPQGIAARALRVDNAGNVHVVMTVAGGLAHALRVGGTWTIDVLGTPPAGAAAVVEDHNGTVHTTGVTSLTQNLHHYFHEQFCVATDTVDAPPARTPTAGLWVPRATTVKPTPRSQAAAVYDSARNEVVMYGGTDDSSSLQPGPAGTWTLPNARSGWVQKAGATAPGRRYQPAMTVDSGRGRVVMMGIGLNDTDVWEWDGTVWTSRPATAPMPTLGFGSGGVAVGLAYDSARSRVVVSAMNGIWDWNGADGVFTARAPSPPAYVTNPSTLFYDAGTGNVIGLGAGKTWEWNPTTNTFTDLGVALPAGVVTQTTSGVFILYDGHDMWRWRRQGPATWERLTTQGTGPMRRQFSSLTYDPVRGAVILFGGQDQYVTGSSIQVYTDPAMPFRGNNSNTTTEWLPPSQ